MIQLQRDYKIIDMHTHIGPEYPLDIPDPSPAGMVRLMDEAQVEFIISSPCEDLFDAGTKREVIVDAMTRFPERIKGYYAINPRIKIDINAIYDSFKKHTGYIGFKMLPDYHRTALSDPAYTPVFEIADKHHMLVLSHTWGLSMNGESCNSADKVIAVLEKYKNITFIMGHSIQGQIDQAIEIARKYPNAYLDLCDSGRINGVIEKMAARAGADKVVFGTDLPMQSTNYVLGAVLAAQISAAEKKLILRDNALRILSKIGRPIK
jgi:predicted TIM-barrel fold metal-dependent hydrolase